MPAVLTKTEFVLGRVGEDIDEMGVPFAQDPEPGEMWNSSTVFMWPDKWEDMGRPTTITVTIEPGDRLNEVAA